jgi:predicted XRE-type DNA-binding protein
MSNEERFSSVWDAIEDTVPAAANMRARSALMMALQSWVKTQRTQTEAAQQLGVTQSRISDLMRGKMNLFAVDSLLGLAELAGLQPQITFNAAADETGLERAQAHQMHTSAGNGAVCAVSPVRDDEDRYVVGTQGAGSTGTFGEEPIKPVKLRRVA